jgi:hypothetical protein
MGAVDVNRPLRILLARQSASLRVSITLYCALVLAPIGRPRDHVETTTNYRENELTKGV